VSAAIHNHGSSLKPAYPRAIVLSLASDFGCQLQLSNIADLLDVLGTIKLEYWQLMSSAVLPADYDIAIIEGAVTTQDHIELLQQVRTVAQTIIAIGSCAITGGVPALAAQDLSKHVQAVYSDDADRVAAGRVRPAPISNYVAVDYLVAGCPIDPREFVTVLQGALLGVRQRQQREPLCAQCKTMEAPCFYSIRAAQDIADGMATPQALCLGLVTRTGCGALCITRGRPCTGCRGIAADANLSSARTFIANEGLDVDDFDDALRIYSSHALDDGGEEQ